MADQSAPRLNMAHGFVKSIVKNQLDRDEYDKNVKLRAFEKQETRRERSKRKEKAIYVPPHLRATAAKNPATPHDQENARLQPEDGKQQSCTSTETSQQAEHQSSSSTNQHPSSRLILQLHLEMKDGSTQKMELHEGEDLKRTVKNFGNAAGLDDRLKKALLHKVKNAMEGRST